MLMKSQAAGRRHRISSQTQRLAWRHCIVVNGRAVCLMTAERSFPASPRLPTKSANALQSCDLWRCVGNGTIAGVRLRYIPRMGSVVPAG
jgi:hypothetical protein